MSLQYQQIVLLAEDEKKIKACDLSSSVITLDAYILSSAQMEPASQKENIFGHYQNNENTQPGSWEAAQGETIQSFSFQTTVTNAGLTI